MNRTCRGCGKEVAADAPMGHCPQCLLQLGKGPCGLPVDKPASFVITPGSRQFGDYELVSQIGRGGMGVVYKARHQKLHRLVAIKMIREAHLASSAVLERFKIEAEAAPVSITPTSCPFTRSGKSEASIISRWS